MNSKLDRYDLNFIVRRLPKVLTDVMTKYDWLGKIYVGGGFIRAIIANEKINDIDVFVNSKEDASKLAFLLASNKNDIHNTDNAITIKGRIPIQIIHRWVFNKAEDVSNSFDFTICCAVIEYTTSKKWNSSCDPRFYTDLAAKRLVYRTPIRNEDAGGSILRVLKYYQRGYRIPLDSLGAVIARLVKGLDTNRMPLTDEKGVAQVITGLLREVDPSIDLEHESHLPSSSGSDVNEIEDVVVVTPVVDGQTNNFNY